MRESGSGWADGCLIELRGCGLFLYGASVRSRGYSTLAILCLIYGAGGYYNEGEGVGDYRRRLCFGL